MLVGLDLGAIALKPCRFLKASLLEPSIQHLSSTTSVRV